MTHYIEVYKIGDEICQTIFGPMLLSTFEPDLYCTTIALFKIKLKPNIK